MCFNLKISISSYIFGLINCIILFKRGYKIEALYYGLIIQMQFIEFLLWTFNKCNKINKFITQIGIFLNHLQPYILYFLIIKYNNDIIHPYIHYMMLYFFIINISYILLNIKTLNKCTIGIPNKKELQWKIHYGKHNEFYILFVIVLAILFINGLKKYNYINASIIVMTYIISYLKYKKSKGVGSIWCLIAAYIPFILNIIYEF